MISYMLKKHGSLLCSVVLVAVFIGLKSGFIGWMRSESSVKQPFSLSLQHQPLPTGGVLGLSGARLFPLAISAEMIEKYQCDDAVRVLESIDRLRQRNDAIGRAALWALGHEKSFDTVHDLPGMSHMLFGNSLYELCCGLIVYTSWSASYAQQADLLDCHITKFGDSIWVNESLVIDLNRLAYRIAERIQAIREDIFPTMVSAMVLEKKWNALSSRIGNIYEVDENDTLFAYYREHNTALAETVSLYAPALRQMCNVELEGNQYAQHIADLHGRHLAGMVKQYNHNAQAVMGGFVPALSNSL